MYKVEYEDLTEKVYKEVRHMILDGTYLPGQKVKQEELAANLGVSRTPLLSALSMLEKELLIESVPRRGYRIREVDLQELLDLYEIRVRLEPLGASEASGHAGSQEVGEELARLRRETESLLIASEETILSRFNQYDFDFHSSIMNISGNTFLSLIISSYSLITLSNLRQLYRDPKSSLNEHILILDAIGAGDSELSTRAMTEHINIARAKISHELAGQEDESN